LKSGQDPAESKLNEDVCCRSWRQAHLVDPGVHPELATTLVRSGDKRKAKMKQRKTFVAACLMLLGYLAALQLSRRREPLDPVEQLRLAGLV